MILKIERDVSLARWVVTIEGDDDYSVTYTITDQIQHRGRDDTWARNMYTAVKNRLVADKKIRLINLLDMSFVAIFEINKEELA